MVGVYVCVFETRSYSVAQAGSIVFGLSLPSKYWDYRHEPLHSALIYILIFVYFVCMCRNMPVEVRRQLESVLFFHLVLGIELRSSGLITSAFTR